MESFDFHRTTVEEAEKRLWKIIDGVRLDNLPKEVSLVTGTGKVQEALLAILKEQALIYHIPASNLGMIIVEIE